MRFISRDRRDQQLEVTSLLLQEMNALCKRHGSTLLIMEIAVHPKRTPSYHALYEREGIPLVDASAHFEEKGYQVPGEGHPNGPANLYWLETTLPTIEKILAEKAGD